MTLTPSELGARFFGGNRLILVRMGRGFKALKGVDP